MVIKCPKCGKDTHFTLSDAKDADGEVYACEHCGWLFRYTNR